MPTDYGFTGQRADSVTGLDYYGARYYDPSLGQFTSADTMLDGLNRYGYVGGNPINSTDPSGQQAVSVEKEDTIFGGAAGVIAGVAITVLAIEYGTGGSQPMSVTVGPVATFKIDGRTIDVVTSGDIWVTKAGALAPEGYYAVGSADWLKYTHAIDVAYASSDVWNARTAPKATTGTPTTTTTGGGSVPQSGLPGSAGAAGSWGTGTGGVPVNPGVQIPISTPPIGIGAGLGVGISSIYVGGTLAIAWLFGNLYAKKADLKQLRVAARDAGIKDEEDFREFGDWLEQEKKPSEGRGPRDHTSFRELVEWAKEWIELYK